MVTAFIALGLAWQALSPEAIQHAQAGIAAQKQGDLKTAIVEFHKVTELAPSLPAAFMNLGAVYVQAHQYEQAVAPLEKALELKPDLIGAEQLLGYALLAVGNASAAIPHLSKAGDKGALGIAQVKTGQLVDAIANLNAALAQHPGDPNLLYYLGRASGLLSKEAMDTLEANYPDAARAHASLGENYAALRQVAEAEKEYREALRIDPEARGVHLALGEMYAKIPDWPRAEQEFRAETKLQPEDAESAYWLGTTLLEEGKLKEARTQLEHADRLRPNMPQTLDALGRAASLDGDSTAAEQFFKKLLSIESTGPLAVNAHFGLASIYRKEGKSTEAARELEAYKAARKP
ncbi:MAG TPA: tetratricopeptide repeat protein [Bryobacteraceae bacterium]|jgi:tetratricopeptide (TPR) repeat protein|nr:tetratricopeptide repeat protein [Bryobacteraceae bacterium]